MIRGFARCSHRHFSNYTHKPRKNRIYFVGLGCGAAISALVGYDGVKNNFTYCGATLRFLRSLKTASLITVDYLLLEIQEQEENYESKLKAVHQKSANRLLETCLKNGGLYIKVGQGFAAINHILPKEYTDTLALLQNECLPTSRDEVQKVFREDFGELPEELYAQFDYTPIAAASLAQVFKATLKSGEPVAVKVQYSDLRERFPSDLGTIMFLQDIIEFFFKDYNFGWILRDLRENLVHEMDFIHEGKNSEKCAADLKKFNFVHVPKVYWDYTKTRVLTAEWIDGFKISDISQIKSNKLNLKEIDLNLFKLFSEQIFHTGFVHADPHPGNIFIRRNQKTGKADLILLDHGLYEELPLNVRLPLCEFWEAAVLRKEGAMQEAAKKIYINDYVRFAEVLFQQPLRLHGGRVKTKLTDADIAYMQEVAKKNFELIMNTLKEMPRNMLFVVRNLNTIRAIGTQHGDVVDRPVVMARYAQSCLYDSNSFFGYLRWARRRISFEYSLWRHSFTKYCLTLYFRFLYAIGRAPEAATTILDDLLKVEIN